MHITVDGCDTENTKIDLGNLALNLATWEELHSAVVIEVAKIALAAGTSINNMWLDKFYTSNACEGVDGGKTDNPTVWEEVAKLYMWLTDDDNSYDVDPVMAAISDSGWQYVDFDSIEDERENFSQGFDGDYATYAEELSSDLGHDIPLHMQPYIDWEKYGKAIIDGMNAVEWNGKTYLFHQ